MTDIPKDFKCDCPIEIKPMAEWIQEETKNCRPCMLGPSLQCYISELEENGVKDKATKLKEVAENEDPLTVCQTMDKIKQEVENPLRERLKEFDCATQINGQNITES
jgi:hypothetical protein